MLLLASLPFIRYSPGTRHSAILPPPLEPAQIIQASRVVCQHARVGLAPGFSYAINSCLASSLAGDTPLAVEQWQDWILDG